MPAVTLELGRGWCGCHFLLFFPGSREMILRLRWYLVGFWPYPVQSFLPRDSASERDKINENNRNGHCTWSQRSFSIVSRNALPKYWPAPFLFIYLYNVRYSLRREADAYWPSQHILMSVIANRRNEWWGFLQNQHCRKRRGVHPLRQRNSQHSWRYHQGQTQPPFCLQYLASVVCMKRMMWDMNILHK